jgi:hypothetical protein
MKEWRWDGLNMRSSEEENETMEVGRLRIKG